MNKALLCTEQEITWLVHHFYERVRQDPLIGPIFKQHIHDWPQHLDTLVNFWSSALLGSARFRGNPMATHSQLDGITPAHFQRWLSLFQQSTHELDNPRLRERANELSQRIAQSLWCGYQVNRQADALPLPSPL